MSAPTRQVLAGLVLGSALLGACARAADGDEQEEAALLSVLAQETELATKTRMNADYVPGIVSVLDGEQLAALGARTVGEAMPYIPGVQALRDGSGSPTVTVRGIPFPFNSGSIQVLLNSVPIGREAAGRNGSALLIPIEQVERIEFVRGPGSVLYGDFAFQGLLNIVTRKTGRQVEAGADDHGARQGNLLLGNDGEREAPWRGSLNLAALASDDAVVPDDSSADERRASGIATFAHGGFSALAQALHRRVDFDPGNPAVLDYDETSWTLYARYEMALAQGLDARFHAQYLDNDIANGGIAFAGAQSEAGADLTWSGWARQNWLAGVEYSHGTTDRAEFVPPLPPGVPAPPVQHIAGKSRTVRSLYLQDQVELTGALRLTLGARYDDNSEIGQRVTPRAALVWQVDAHNILKAQYSEGYRSPTFFELYASPTLPDLDFEVNRTAELNYIHQRPGLAFRATVFDTHIDDMVFPHFPLFGNFAFARSHGAELELNQELTRALRLDANATWQQSRDNRNPLLVGGDIASVPNFMANVGLLWTIRPRLTLGLHWNHIDGRDEPGAASGDDRADLTLTRRDLFAEGLDLRVGVNNLFDSRTEEINQGALYDSVFPYTDRTVWARLGWHW